MAQTVKITPASGLLEFIGNTTSNKPYLQHDDNGNLTLTLQATKKFTVAGNLKVNGKVTMAQQTLTDGAAITWDFNSGANAKVTIAGARTLVISNMETGDTGLILVKQDAAGGRTLSLPSGSSIVGGGSYTASSAANATDVLGVYYDGTTYWWTIGYNTVTPPLTSVGITGSDFTISNSPLTSNGNIGLALATVNSNVGTFGSASAVPVITVNAKGLITAVSATNISIPTNLDSLTDVTISSAVNGQLLQFNGSQWVNWTPNYLTGITSGQVTTALGYTPVPNTRNLTINGVTQNLTADRTWTIDTVSYVSRVQHGVKAGVAINKGQAVYVTSADGTNMIVGLASNTSEATSSKTMGLLDATVATNGMANVVTEGLLTNVDTSLAGSAGDPVWLGANGNLIFGLANKPYAPNHLVFIGIVTRKNANTGEIFVKVQNGFELNEIHDVDLRSTVPVSGHILGYDGTLWVNKTIAGWLGFTPANDANVVHTSGNETISGIKTFSGTTQATSTTTGTIVTGGGVGIAKNLYVGGDINVVGNLIIGGTTTTVYAQNLSVSDNMIYLNNGVLTTITNAVGNGSTVVYTTAETHNYIAGMSVTITGITPSAYNLSNQTITAVGTNSFTIANTATGSYSSGGTARAKTNANPDLGFAAGYNDGSYAHAGLFRDATDNVWKFFKGYTPEPDASPFIDTSHASFAYADLRANDITGRSFIKDGGTSSQFLKADGSVDSSTYLTTGTAGSTYQPLDADLTAIAALATTGFLKRTGANTWALDSNTYLTGITSTDVINALGYTPVTNARTITINGVTYDLSANRSWTITAGVSSVSAGTGISVNTTTGAVTVTNTGLLSGTAGLGISVSTSSGNLNIVNTGLLSGTAGLGISVSTSSGNLNIVNTGLLSGTAGSGISVSTASGNLNIVNTGLLSATAGAGISVSTSSGNLNIVNTITNLNQLTNGPGYITGITSGMVTTALGYTPWHAGNDGAGSGLDADLLDGLSSGSFLRSDLEVNYTDNIFRIYTEQGVTGDTVGSATTLQIYQADVNRDAFQTFHISGDYAVHFGLDGLTNDLFVGGWSMGPVKYRIWHEGNLTNLNQLTNGPGYITSSSLSGYATQTYVTTQINNLINGAPGALNTLDELAAALGDDANFATTVTNSIAGKVSKSGDTMTGNLSFGATSGLGLNWGLNTDAAFIRFVSSGNQAGGSYLEIGTQDDLDEEIKFTQSGNIRFYLATDGRLKTGSGYNYVWEDGTWGISVTGNAGTVTNGVYTTGSYANPAWITSLAWSKITGAPAAQTLSISGSTLSISGGNSVTLPSGGISQGTADSLYVNVTGDVMTGNLFVEPTMDPAQIQLSGSNPELYINATGGTARMFINRATQGNQSTLMFTTGMNVTRDAAWDFTGMPMWSMGMTNNNNTDSFKLAYGDIYDPNSVALEITTANVAYFKYVPYAAGNLLATQSWVQSQGYLTSVSDVWVNTSGDTMTGILRSSYNTATGIGNNSFNVAKTIIGNYHIQNGAGTSGNNYQAAITFQGGSSSESQAGIYVSNNSSTGTAMGFATTDSYATGPQLFMTATNVGLVNFPRTTPTVQGNTIWHAGNDGSGSGLDADLLDGYNSDTVANVNTIVRRDSSGNIYSNYVLGTYFNASAGNSSNPTIGQIWTQDIYDNYLRKSTPSHFRSQITDGYYLSLGGGTVSGNVNLTGQLGFLDGNGSYSNIIRSAAYPSEGYPDGTNYWLEYRSWGGHHFVLNVDGGAGASLFSADDFVIWQGAIDGDRLLELSNTGTLTIADRLIELSSIRYKTNVESLTPALDKIMQLRPVTYYKIGLEDKKEIGLIAEEVESIYPELIKYDNEGQVDGINYTRIAPILIKTIQEQQELIKNLTKRIDDLENR